MHFERVYSKAGKPVREQVEWKRVDVSVLGVYEQRGVEVPAAWSDNAAQILASKYFRKAQVPSRTKLSLEHGCDARMPPEALWPRVPAADAEFGGETSAHQVFHRLAGCWTYWGWREGYFDYEDARVFYDELYMMLALQVAAPNSPQWFNTGLHWAYGITGNANGQWTTDADGNPYLTANAYERPQPHACFLTDVEDDLVNEGGIMDAWVREARIFKFGSGSGTNISKLRGKKEKLSGGGAASGAMSFLRVGDRSAGAIQSGGTTRRAALLRIMNADHPEIEDFIWWKVREEEKAVAMYLGSQVMRDYVRGLPQAFTIPEAMLDRFAQGFEPKEWGIGWEGEAIDTVSGQNSNNSVRLTDEFFYLATGKKSGGWQLRARTDGSVIKEVDPRDLWDQICRAAWASADPGLMFHNTINAWNTCAADGEITTSNPCCEFHHLCGTEWGSSACNLASLRLTAFLEPDCTVNVSRYAHACRFWTVVLDISVSMASFPAREFALGAYNYRTLGLGYMDLGGLLMRSGLPYDSESGRALAAALTALMTGVAYTTSGELAAELGAFPRWAANAAPMARVLRNHAAAARVVGSDWEGLNVHPLLYDRQLIPLELQSAVELAWERALGYAALGYRNAQTTLLAPTGTIYLVTDCDTSGVEPDLGLVKHKFLAGGGEMTIVNQAVEAALRRLGYTQKNIDYIERRVRDTGTVPIRHEKLDAGGTDYDFIGVLHEHAAVFDCANPAVPGGRYIRPLAHVEMVAAVQPFLSGAVSKTINLPRDATVADVDHVYRESHRLGLKAVALYREGCKLTQPLSVAKPAEEEVKVADFVSVKETLQAAGFFTEQGPTPLMAAAAMLKLFPTPPQNYSRGQREFLPWRREDGYTQKVKIGDQSVFLTVNRFPDGRPGEMYLELSHEGSTLRAMADLVAMAVSVGLQYGVPVAEYVERFTHVKFEPAGVVEGHDRISVVSSIADYIGRELGITFLDREDLAQKQVAVAVGTDARVVALDKRAVAVASGYSGEICRRCGNATLRRAGACLACDTCGETTGCG